MYGLHRPTQGNKLGTNIQVQLLSWGGFLWPLLVTWQFELWTGSMCCILGQHHVLVAVHSTQTPSPTFLGRVGLHKGLQSTSIWRTEVNIPSFKLTEWARWIWRQSQPVLEFTSLSLVSVFCRRSCWLNWVELRLVKINSDRLRVLSTALKR